MTLLFFFREIYIPLYEKRRNDYEYVQNVMFCGTNVYVCTIICYGGDMGVFYGIGRRRQPRRCCSVLVRNNTRRITTFYERVKI